MGAFYSPSSDSSTNIIFTDYFNITKNNFSTVGDFNA